MDHQNIIEERFLLERTMEPTEKRSIKKATFCDKQITSAVLPCQNNFLKCFLFLFLY